MQKFNYQKSNKATGKIYIGLDHGYGNIKTAHRVFQTGIECYDEEPIVSTNYVKYRDGYREELVHLFIIGGGGCLLKNFFDLTAKSEVTVITDICANAKGYEALAMMKQRMRG